MKRILILTAVLMLLSACGKKEDAAQMQKEQPAVKQAVWTYNIEDAVKTANEQNKAVLVNFTGSDWCGWCFRLRDEVFVKPEFVDYADSSLVLVELDYPQRKEQSEETKAYNRKKLEDFGVRGFPTILLIDRNGKEIARTGYQQGGATAYVRHLNGLIK